MTGKDRKHTFAKNKSSDMKHKLLTLLCAIILCGCKEEAVITMLPEVVIEDAGDGKVRLVPSGNTSYLRYVFADRNESEDFVDGNLSEDGISEGTSSLVLDISEREEEYLMALAYDSEDRQGGLALYRIKTLDISENLDISETYLTHCSAGIRLKYPSEYCRIDYYLGSRDDREDFIAGDKCDSTLFDLYKTEYYINAFDLTPETEYILYLSAYDRTGQLCGIAEYPVTTAADGSCPKISMELTHNDVYKSDIVFTANELADSITTMPIWEGPEEGIAVRNGDIFGAMDSFIAEFLWGKTTTAGREQERTELNSLYTGSEKYFYAVAYGNGKRYLYRLMYKTPDYNENAPECKITLTISDTTRWGATYDFTGDEDTFAFLWKTVDADWFDETSGQYGDTDEFCRQYLMSNGKLVYKDQLDDNHNYQYVERQAGVGKRVYVIVCPFNENGYDNGWSGVIKQEYTTLSNN